jgi:ferric-dicitrate binding protein FerR (iron transport regulator)
MDEKLDAETEALLSALEAGELDGAKRDEAEALLAKSTAARAALARLKALRVLMAELPDRTLAAGARRRIGDAVVASMDAGRRRRRAWTTFAAALTLAVAALVVALVPWRHGQRPTAAERDVRTGPDEHRLVQAGDRATVFVSESSSVHVAAAGDDGPPLRVISGRVRLIVKPDRERPFVVASAAADAVVYGTEFDVDVRGDTTEVRVAHGEVEMRNTLGARRLWSGETASARVGVPPRRIERIVPVVIDEMPEIQKLPAPRH